MESERDHLGFLQRKPVRTLLIRQLYLYVLLAVGLGLGVILRLLDVVERIQLHLPMVTHVVLPHHVQCPKGVLFGVVYLELGLDWLEHEEVAPHLLRMEGHRFIENRLYFVVLFRSLDFVQVDQLEVLGYQVLEVQGFYKDLV